jgi:hypothetical protein
MHSTHIFDYVFDSKVARPIHTQDSLDAECFKNEGEAWKCKDSKFSFLLLLEEQSHHGQACVLLGKVQSTQALSGGVR